MGRTTSGGGGIESGAELSNPSIVSLSTSFSVSYYRESWIMCWNQVENEKKKKVEKESWRKKERGRSWKVEGGEKKGRGKGYMGIRVWWRKTKRKKRRIETYE